jgi:porin
MRKEMWLLSSVLAGASALAGESPDCGPGCRVSPSFQLDTIYTGDAWRNMSGGRAIGNRYLDNLDIMLDANTGPLLGAENLRFFTYVLHDHGRQLSDELTGSAQGVSNIETDGALRLYEIWTEWQMSRTPGSLRVGLYDLNSEFDSIETAGIFVNPSNGIGPDFAQSGRNGPSIFPHTSLAVRYATQRGRWSLQSAMLDGVPGDPDHPERTHVSLSNHDGLLFVNEVNYQPANASRFGLGYWRYTAAFEDLMATDDAGEPLTRHDNDGFYAIAESPFLFSRDKEVGTRFFLRVGATESRINPIERYYGFGAVYNGRIGNRLSDQIGLAVSIAELGAPTVDLMTEDSGKPWKRETIVELTYRADISGWLMIQPDIQYIQHPGMDRGTESAWLIGLRFQVNRGWSW